MRRNKSRGRDFAMMLGGIGTGIMASRLLPPLVASMMASRRVRTGGDPFALLIEDHRKIQSLLDQMLEAPTDSKLKRARLFAMLKRKLAKHAVAEEDVVYPRVRNDAAEGDERKHLYDEHAEMKIFLYDLEEMLKSGEDWTGAVGPLRDLIRRHIDEEEKTIFPELRRELTQARWPKLSGQISREEAMIL